MTYTAKHCKDCFERLTLDEMKNGDVRCSRFRFRMQVMARQLQKGNK